MPEQLGVPLNAEHTRRAGHLDRLDDAVVRQTLAEVLTHRRLIEWVGASTTAVTAHEGEHLFAIERLVVSPAAGASD